MNKKGQSQVIVTVLVILIVLAAVIIVWNVVNSVVSESGDEVEINSFTTEIEIKETNFPGTGGATIEVRTVRGEMDALKFIFFSETEDSITIDKTENIPTQLETKTFTFTAAEIPASTNKISVIPIIDGKNGIEVSKTI